jgi:polysaccharide biosynthesis transport protein
MDTTKSYEQPEVKLHFLDYWRIIRIRKTVILAVFLLVAITVTLVTFVLPPKYASTVKISIDKDATDVSGIGEIRAVGGYDPYWMQTEYEKIQSKTVLYPVLTELSLAKKWGEKFKEGELPLNYAYLHLKRNLTVNQSRNTSLIEITAESDDYDEAALIANKVAEAYKNFRMGIWEDRATNGLKILLSELELQNKKIAAAQAKLDELRKDLGISDVDPGASQVVRSFDAEIISKLEGERIQAQGELARIDSLYRSLTNCSRAEQKRIIGTAYPDDRLNTLMKEQAAEQQRLVTLTNVFAANYPEVRSTRDKLAVIEAQIDAQLDGIVNGIKLRADSDRARIQDLALNVERAKTNEMAQTERRRPYDLLKRELESLYYIRDRLAVKVQQDSLEAKLPRENIVQIVEKAEPNLIPVKPRKLVNIILGVVVGLVVGVGLAFFIEYLDTSVKTIDDVERALQAPVLGVIPQNVGYLIEEGPDSPHAEAYRVLRTNILFSQKDPKLNTITIVSGGAGEGKSTTIFNLASVFAQNGSRVLVVDSDLRRPSLHKILKVSNSIGLTNYLLKQNTLEEVIQTTSLASLDFLPSGKLPSSSMGVLSSAQMKELIRDLKRRYDYVFFDSPPIMGVSDASILASEVDCVLQVIQYRRYPQPMTIRAKQMIEKVGGNLLGIVLNNINMASDENYYYYSGYYYDYYSKSEDSKPEGAAPAGATVAAKDDEGVEIKPKY